MKTAIGGEPANRGLETLLDPFRLLETIRVESCEEKRRLIERRSLLEGAVEIGLELVGIFAARKRRAQMPKIGFGMARGA